MLGLAAVVGGLVKGVVAEVRVDVGEVVKVRGLRVPSLAGSAVHRLILGAVINPSDPIGARYIHVTVFSWKKSERIK